MPGPPLVLGALDPSAPSPFGRHSIVRRMVAQPVTALLVQRALVMEVAHPAVAAGVEHHSRFRAHPLSRAWVTVDAGLRLVFGDDHVARGAVRQIYRVHDHINGNADPGRSGHPSAAGDTHGGAPRPTGVAAPYSAHDASLLTWVWATLVDTTEVAFTRWVRPLTPAEVSSYYAEMRAFGRFLGIPDALLPADRPALARYVSAMVDDEHLGSSTESRALARQVLWFRHWSVPPALVRLERVLALATLDPRLADRLELVPSPADAALGRRLDALLATHYRRLPRFPSVVPGLYVRLRRPSIGLAARIGVGPTRRPPSASAGA